MPWLFEISRMAHEVTPYPVELVLFLIIVYHVHARRQWSILDCILLATLLALLTYTYAIGRLLGPLLALGLALFASDQRRLHSVLETWALYGISFVPLLIFNLHHPGLLQKRFLYLTYLHHGMPFRNIASAFVKHYIANLNPTALLFAGDPNPRHHVPGAMGSILVAVFITAVAGIFIILMRHRNDAWWRFVLFGAAVSILPGALTVDVMHTLRLIAFPIFLLILTIPAIEWLLRGFHCKKHNASGSRQLRQAIAVTLGVLMVAQAAYFQFKFTAAGPTRGDWFDASFPQVLTAATAMPNRPIYLIGDRVRTNTYWYATIQGRALSAFLPIEVASDESSDLPSDSLMITSDANCVNCRLVFRGGRYLVYVHNRADATAVR
jgi:hypothetical protein